MQAFITGSRYYGNATSESDLDLVIYVDDATKEKLIELSDSGKLPCKYGDLNLIFATTPEEYAAWLLGRKLSKDETKLDKDQAIKLHDKARELFGVKSDHDSVE